MAACYRGYRVYDSDVTKALVKKWVDFYKQHRDILNSDVVHVRRADMQVGGIMNTSWRFPRYWPFVRGMNRSPVDSSRKEPVMLSFVVFFAIASAVCWTNSPVAVDLRLHAAYVTLLGDEQTTSYCWT